MALFVYGGSFNPPHLAHVLALCLARAQAGSDFDAALVIPTFQHPLAKELAPYPDRVAMAEAAMGWIPGVAVSRIEEELGGESRTVRTLEELHRRHPQQTLRLLVGADILLERHKWHGWDRIQQLAPLYVLGRVGVDHPDAPAPHLPMLSSTVVRAAAVRQAWDEVSACVPAGVLEYLQTHRVYERA